MRFFRFVVQRSGRARWVLVAATIVGVVSGVSSVSLLALLHRALATPPGASLGHLALLFLGLGLVVSASRVLSGYLISRLGHGIVFDLRMELARQVLGTPLARLEALGPGRLLAALTDDVNKLTTAISIVPVVAINITVVLGCLSYLAWLNTGLFFLLLGAVVVGVATYQVPARRGKQLFFRARDQEDVLLGRFRGLTDGIKELKLHRGRRGGYIADLRGVALEQRRLRVIAGLVFGSAAAWGHLLFFAVLGVLLFARPAFLHPAGDVLVGYTIVLLYMMTPLQSVLDSIPALGNAEVAVEKVARLGLTLAGEQEAVRSGDEVQPVLPWNRLELVGVRHTYRREGQERDFTLGPLDLALRPGEIVFLVGGNGSGKTTLAKILVGLYAPEGGVLRFDGRPVREADFDEYRQLFSAVFSDFYLFERLLGLESETVDDEARRYLGELQLAHKVEVRDGRLSTTELSQGQRKRLALLTAYLEDRPVYVFDEWAADQDPTFKEVFYREILPTLRQRGKALLVISHDDRYFPLADRIVKLEDGQLAYDGPATGFSYEPVRTAAGA